MSNCTCTADKQMTCIVHPTSVSLKERIAELEVEAENAKTYMVKLSNAVTEVVAENQRLREAAVEFIRHSPLEDGDYLWTQEYEKVKRELQKVLEGGDG